MCDSPRLGADSSWSLPVRFALAATGLLGGPACSFDVSGVATTSATSGLTDSDGDASADAATTEGGSETLDLTGDPSTTGSDVDGGRTTDDDTSESSTSASESSNCDDAVATALLWVQDAETTNVEILASTQLPPVDGDPVQFARSFNAAEGDARFDFEVNCTGPVYAWALVWDADGESTVHSDSLLFAYDDEPPDVADRPVWPYGCASDFEGAAWRWHPLSRGTEPECRLDRVVVDLDPGPHSLTLTNAETGGQPGPVNNYAGLAAIVLSSDPETAPATLYDPTPR